MSYPSIITPALKQELTKAATEFWRANLADRQSDDAVWWDIETGETRYWVEEDKDFTGELANDYQWQQNIDCELEERKNAEILIYPKKNKTKKKVKNFLAQIEESDISSKVKETVDEKETPFMPQFYFKKHFPNLTQEEYDEFCERWVDERRYEEIDDIVRDTFAQWKNDAKDICVGCGENVGEVNLTEDHLGDPKCEDCFEEPLPWCYDEHTECVCGHNCAPPS